MYWAKNGGHVHDQIADHRQARQRPDHNRLAQFFKRQDARQDIAAIHVHRVRTANPFAAGAAKPEAVVLLFQQQKRIQKHRAAALVRQFVILHTRTESASGLKR